MFTANDIDGLPDPLIDRLDVWSVDLPTPAEREAIWRIHIAKRRRDPERFLLGKLAQITEGFSGRQIEQVWIKAMTLAFNDGHREPGIIDIEAAAKKFVPTSVTMGDAIEARRKRLANRATPASHPAKVVPLGKVNGRKLAA
jgi:SpoVK/Ycf46/Vps4 family AAA+-type ATPase